MLFTIGLLTTVLTARADTCDTDSSIMWVLPSTGEYEVPPETVYRALIGQGDSPSTAFSVHLYDRDGNEVPASVEITEHPGNDPFEVRYLHTLVPDEPLQDGIRYSFEVEHESGDPDLGRSMSAMVTLDEPAEIEALPSVEVLTSYDEQGSEEDACDYSEMRTFDLYLHPAEADPTGRSVMHLYRMASEGSDWHYIRAYRVAEDGSGEEISVSFDRNLDWGSCFAVIQENIAGEQSPASFLGCAATTIDGLTSEDDPGPTDGLDSGSGYRGCSSTGSGTAMSWLSLTLAALLGYRRRR